jgi:hypothetical protein
MDAHGEIFVNRRGIDPVIYEALGLSEEVLEQIQEQVRKKVAEASQLYGMVAA